MIQEKRMGAFMLKNIPKILSPDLIKILCEMGHGDELVIADANFPAESCGKRVIRADGHGGAKMLEAVLSVIPLDTYAKENFVLMQVVEGDNVRPTIWEEYKKSPRQKIPTSGRALRSVSPFTNALKRPMPSSQRGKKRSMQILF